MDAPNRFVYLLNRSFQNEATDAERAELSLLIDSGEYDAELNAYALRSLAIRAYKDENVIISGAKSLKLQWQPYKNGILKAQLDLCEAPDILEESKLFNIEVTTAPATDSLLAWSPDFKGYNVVIQNTNNIHNKTLRWPRRIEEKLEQYVADGGGLYILHSANNAFPHWKEYDRMIGLGWRLKETGFALEIDRSKKIIRIPPGEGSNTSHGERFDALINILSRHPINNDFPEQWRTASMELYTHARGPAENVTVLSYAFDIATNKNWPVDWVVEYGKGRVYNSSMGHLWKGENYPISYRCIGFQTTMIRAVEWLATGNVTYPLPAKFPHASISVLDE